MERRPFSSKRRYVISFIIGTFIFLMVFGLSYSISYLEFQRVSNLQGVLAYDIFTHKLDYSLFDKGVCDDESFEKVSRDLNFQGRIIDDLEKSLGKDNKDVLFRKKFYTLIELEHFEFVKLLNQRCEFNIQTILFFYSNENRNLENSEDVGRMLTTVFKRSGNIMIYSFDVNLDSELINELKKKYNIEEPQTLIINDKFTVLSPKNIDEIERHLS